MVSELASQLIGCYFTTILQQLFRLSWHRLSSYIIGCQCLVKFLVNRLSSYLVNFSVDRLSYIAW